MSKELLLCLAFVLSFALMCFIMPHYINLLKRAGANQNVSEYALKDFKEKGKTPIMGGLLFVLIPSFIVLIINPSMIKDHKALVIILSYISFCLIGFADDILILLRHNNDGLAPKLKLILQFVFAAIIYFIFKDVFDSNIRLPFTSITLNFGIIYPFFLVLLYAAEANAVNFTDGMDGLCAGVSAIALIAFFIIALAYGEDNIAIIIIAVIASLLGYLVFNHYPAKIFMGDSGSLALGALFASLGLIFKQEVALFFIGGVFVYEMFCVCLQLTSVILFHKRIFSYTPIHYAFRLKGIPEKRIVNYFYLLSAICATVGLFIALIG